MTEQNTYTLEELAEAFGLTPRTTRYYIEKVLPPHHKQGRGKLALYGQDTWNCFAFIQKVREQAGVTMAYLADVLASLDQAQIDRVAEGREDLRVVTAPSMEASMPLPRSSGFPSASRRAKASHRVMEQTPERILASERQMKSVRSALRKDIFDGDNMSSWQDLYVDEGLRISHKGHASPEQREQVRLAAKLIKNILSLFPKK